MYYGLPEGEQEWLMTRLIRSEHVVSGPELEFAWYQAGVHNFVSNPEGSSGNHCHATYVNELFYYINKYDLFKEHVIILLEKAKAA